MRHPFLTPTMAALIACSGPALSAQALPLVSAVDAAPAPTIAYQGRLLEGATAVNGARAFTFSILDSAGAEQWSSGPLTLTVTEGLYSVVLGSAEMPTLPVAMLGKAGLKLHVLLAGQALTPDATIVPAFQARSAWEVTGSFGGDLSGTQNQILIMKLQGTPIDLTTNAPTAGQALVFNGTKWVPSTVVGTPGPAGAPGTAGATGAQGPIGLTGTTGATGVTGAAGTNGLDGKTVLNGTANPIVGDGANGDFYLNTTASTLWGPKVDGVWPVAGVSLVGPAGSGGSGTVTSVSGTSNRISVTNGTSTPRLDIAATYLGQTSITTLGTITSGTWSGSFGAVSGANLTSLNAGNISSGTVSSARLGTGTASNSTFLRGDGTWAAAGGGSQWTTSGSNIYYPTGKVGIGSSAPAAMLDVGGEARIHGLTLGFGPSVNNSNTVFGMSALAKNSTGAYNVAMGWDALTANVEGNYNVAIGASSLPATTGSYNTGVGMGAGQFLTTGNHNTSVGDNAGSGVATGTYNIAIGSSALGSSAAKTSGGSNIAIGYKAEYQLTTGNRNIAIGDSAGGTLTTGYNNTAIGYNAGNLLDSGTNNLAFGYLAGSALVSGSYNIDIGNPGLSTDDRIIRIGSGSNQNATYIAGIKDVTLTGTTKTVVIDTTTGQLGSVTSSGGSGSGTVTSVSVTSANGFGGSVATATATPAITLSTSVTGLLKGNGTGVSAASAGTDYQLPLSFTSPLSNASNTVSLGTVGVANGGTGSATQNFVDLTTTQTIAGSKTFSGGLNVSTGSTYKLGGADLLHRKGNDSNLFLGVGTGAAANNMGQYNTAIGNGAGSAFTVAYANTFVGYSSGASATGTGNSFFGKEAGLGNTTGDYNTAVGYQAGKNLVAGSNNIDLGNAGLSGDSGIIRIGTKLNQTKTFIAGIRDVGDLTDVQTVVIDANGQLGITGGGVSGTGTVTSVSVTLANGFGGSVATATATPAITLSTSVTGLLKGNGTGVSAASAGTDYQVPLSFSSPLSNTSNTVSLGTVAVASGGTGQTGYAVGDLLYASTTTALSKLADVDTGNSLISGGVGVAPSWGKIRLTTHVIGYLPVTNGGTGNTALATKGGVIYALDTNQFASTGAGTSGQVLLSRGTSNPVWSSNISGTADNVTGTVAVANGGTGLTTYAKGDLLVGSASGTLSTLAAASDGYVLTLASGIPSWSTASASIASDGTFSTKAGTSALSVNTAQYVTGMGYKALEANTSGEWCTAMGAEALMVNTTGGYNTAVGHGAISANITGQFNTGIGTHALEKNTASNNTALGAATLSVNTTGSNNTALGYNAGLAMTSGNNNIALGYNAGAGLTSGSNNIVIGSINVGNESNTLRIGDANIDSVFITGIRGKTSSSGVAVIIDSNGHLGTTTSSRRFKENIQDMAQASSRIFDLRPVTFNYKAEYGGGGTQFGLIAEEVDQVIPEMTIRDKDGQIETVAYQLLPPMLLNELQKQQRTIEAQRAEIDALKAQVAAILARLPH